MRTIGIEIVKFNGSAMSGGNLRISSNSRETIISSINRLKKKISPTGVNEIRVRLLLIAAL